MIHTSTPYMQKVEFLTFFSGGICGKFCDLNQMQKCRCMLNRTTDIKYSVVCYNERCYNERMLRRTIFINKIRMLQRTEMLQRTWRNTIGRRSTLVRTTYRNFQLRLERKPSSLLSFVRFIYKFRSAICLFVPLEVKIYIFKLFCYIILAMSRQSRVRKLLNVHIKK